MNDRGGTLSVSQSKFQTAAPQKNKKSCRKTKLCGSSSNIQLKNTEVSLKLSLPIFSRSFSMCESSTFMSFSFFRLSIAIETAISARPVKIQSVGTSMFNISLISHIAPVQRHINNVRNLSIVLLRFFGTYGVVRSFINISFRRFTLTFQLFLQTVRCSFYCCRRKPTL